MDGTLSQCPVTATAYIGHHVLLSQGPYLKIINHHSQVPTAAFKVFNTQAIHGIDIHKVGPSNFLALLWGGHYVRLVSLDENHSEPSRRLYVNQSNIVKNTDWILHGQLHVPEVSLPEQTICGAIVSAHNALYLINIAQPNARYEWHPSPSISLSDLSAETRCMLYAAKISWLSSHHIVVASGTAFGEILVWSCLLARDKSNLLARSSIKTHYVFNAHEGSIFGLDISKRLTVQASSQVYLFLASCSDDRTIRVWNVSAVLTTDTDGTMFSSVRKIALVPDEELLKKPDLIPICIARAWAHKSRIWNIVFSGGVVENSKCTYIGMVSCGEDAICQLYSLRIEDTAANDGNITAKLITGSKSTNHHGKNIWAVGIPRMADGEIRAVTGGADGAVSAVHYNSDDINLSWATSELFGSLESSSRRLECSRTSTQEQIGDASGANTAGLQDERASKALGTDGFSPSVDVDLNGDVMKSYTFVNSNCVILVTLQGHVVLGRLEATNSDTAHEGTFHRAETKRMRCTHLGHFEDMTGYSVVTSVPQSNLAFIGTNSGAVYVFSKRTMQVLRVANIRQRVTGIFAQAMVSRSSNTSNATDIFLLMACQPSSIAYWCILSQSDCESLQCGIRVEIFEQRLSPPRTITSVLVINEPAHKTLFIGSRTGSIESFLIWGSQCAQTTAPPQEECHTCKPHLDSVTCMLWNDVDVARNLGHGYLLTTGRDSSYSILKYRLETRDFEIVHQSTVPLGPFLEGAFVNTQNDHLILYGFRSRDFVVYDETDHLELFTVDCGGAHREWQLHILNNAERSEFGINFLWTQATKLNFRQSRGPKLQRFIGGGHGREIKACAVRTAVIANGNDTKTIIATGAEDTDIRIFEQRKSTAELHQLKCLLIVRKHKTGIQALQWSRDGQYLFSSGGTEEFYLWKVTENPYTGIGVVCVSEKGGSSWADVADLRITSFDVVEHGPKDSSEACGKAETSNRFQIAMAMSNSTFQIIQCSRQPRSQYARLPPSLCTAHYKTNCLTAIRFLQTTPSESATEHAHIVTGSTDGHLAFWNLKMRAQTSTDAYHPQPRPYRVAKVHQSAIHDLAVANISEQSCLLITAGDDNAVGLTLLSIPPVSMVHSETFPTGRTSTLVIPRAHAAAVRSVAVLSRTSTASAAEDKAARTLVTIATVSNDQRMKLWEVSLPLVSGATVEEVGVRRLGNHASTIADAAAVNILSVSRKTADEAEDSTTDSVQVELLVCGVGIEVMKLKLATDTDVVDVKHELV